MKREERLIASTLVFIESYELDNLSPSILSGYQSFRLLSAVVRQ